MPSQDELLSMLAQGLLGPWAGQGFVPGGITVLRPDTWQWETILSAPGSAEMSSTLSDPVDVIGLEADPSYTGVFSGLGITTSVGSGGTGHPQASVISAQAYTWQNFTETELGTIRMTIGMSNGATGPLSPIQMGTSLMEVDQNGNLWLPKVRFGK